MAGPCDGKQQDRNNLDWRWREAKRDLENNPDHKRIQLLNETVVSLTKAISASKDKNEIEKLTNDKKIVLKDIDGLSPNVRPLSSSCNDLKLKLDDAEKELHDCLELHKHDKGDKGGGQTR
jgi:hypothetical protein